MAKYNDLNAFVQEDKPSIIILTETWLSASVPDGIIALDGYTIYRSDRNRSKGGGVCIYLADQIFSEFHIKDIGTDLGGVESLFLELTTNTTSFVLGCIYRPSSTSIDNDRTLIELILNLTAAHEKVFIFGDFNMADIRWPIDPSRHHKPSSQFLVDMITSTHLNQLVTQPTRYRLGQSPSTLDLVITSDEHSLTNLDYLDPIGKSDHIVLTVDLQICKSSRTRTVSLKRAVIDYNAVNRGLSKFDWHSLLSKSLVTDNWTIFKSCLHSTVARHTTFVNDKRSSKKPWINAKILSLIRNKRTLWRVYKRTGSECDYKTHRKFSNRLSATIKEARCVYESNIAESKDTKRLYKYLHTKLSGPVGKIQIQSPFGDIIENSKDIADTFADAFSHMFTNEPPGHIPKILGSSNPTSLSEIVFTPTVVHKKLASLDASKSPGPDLITAKCLSNCADTLCKPLCILMTQSFHSGLLPLDWRTALIRPIFKKGDKFNANNYRPISLTSIIIKLMESIIYDQLIKFLNEHQLIPIEQHGFLPGKSIQSNLLCCLSDWTKENDGGNSLDVLYLDFSKAFDRVPKRRLLHKIKHLGISGKLYNWIDAYLTDRTFRVKVENSLSKPVKVLSGVPQGSVLGPLLFIAYTADLKISIESPFAMYADDIKLYNNSCKNIILKKDLLAIYNWSKDWLLPLNCEKCYVLHIGKKNPKCKYYLGGNELTKTECCRDLGIFINQELTWSDHIAHTVKKANSVLFLLGKAFSRIHPVAFSKLYKTFVRPILEFGNSIWTPVLQRDIHLLESVQRKATRRPFGRVRPQYHERLSLMQLTTLSDRRIRGDLITTFQALTNPISPIRQLYMMNLDPRLRGHKFKLQKQKFYTTPRQVFLTNRVFNSWNMLPIEVIQSQSLQVFKKRYDHYRAQTTQ